MSDEPHNRPLRKHVTITLTHLEARMLDLCVGNGYDSGDFEDWLSSSNDDRENSSRVRALRRGIRKLEDGLREVSGS
jgi:hypothetical protein